METLIRKIVCAKETVLHSEKGSLSLEHVLFIGAVAGTSAAILAFYGNIGDYLTNVNLADSPSGLGSQQ